MIVGLLVAAGGIAFAPFLNLPLVLLAFTVASLGMGIFYLASMGFLNEIVPNYLKGTMGYRDVFWPPIINQIAICASFQTSMAGYSFLIYWSR